jgi:transmembrane sensor
MNCIEPASPLVACAPRKFAREMILRLASGDITDQEMTALRNWIEADRKNRAAFEAERAGWRMLAPLRAELAGAIGPSLEPVTRPNVIQLRRRARWVAAGAALAACLTVFVSATDIITRLRADHITAIGEVAEFRLPDGSFAVLNTESAISVHFEGAERGIDLLRGEAWFRVRKDASRPFRVHSREGVAEAVGTAFGVRSGDDQVTVSVTEGVVAVRSPEAANTSEPSAVKVTAGYQTFYAPGHGPGDPSAFDATAALAWRRHHIVIDDRPLSEAIGEINRYRRGRIILMDAAHGDAHVSGVFSVDELDHGLEGLAATQGLSVTRVTPYLVFLR